MARKTGEFEVSETPWIRFEDAKGNGLCSPDFILRVKGGQVLVVEAKWTWVSNAALKLRALYLPLVMHLEASLKVGGLVICRNLTPETGETLKRFDELRRIPLASIATLQWLGTGPL